MMNPSARFTPPWIWASISSIPPRITEQVTAKLFWASALKGKRDKVVIATKFGHIVNEEKKTVYGDPDQIIKNVRTDVENSLRRLQTDFIDIYQLHAGDYDPKLALELQVVLEELVSAGKIRWYGWSTDVVDSAREFAAQRSALHIHPIPLECHLRQRRHAQGLRGL